MPEGGGAHAGNAANPDIRFAPLMFHTTVEATLALFAALAFERRVVISGSDLSTLSAAVHAANAMLYPLTWHGAGDSHQSPAFSSAQLQPSLVPLPR